MPTTCLFVPSVAAGTAAPATYDYGYARTAPAAAYDTTKTYYQQTPATQAYSTADYQGWQTAQQSRR